MSLKEELQSIDPQIAAQAVNAWVAKMADLLGMPQEFITERLTKAERYPVIAAIGIALVEHAELLEWGEQRASDVGLGAKLALSVLTEIAEVQALPINNLEDNDG